MMRSVTAARRESWRANRTSGCTSPTPRTIPPDSPLDLKAHATDASLYLPEGQVAISPPQVITLLGLGWMRVSHALSLALRFDADGTPGIAAVLPSWLHVQRLTYEAADTQMDRAPFDRMYEIARGL